MRFINRWSVGAIVLLCAIAAGLFFGARTWVLSTSADAVRSGQKHLAEGKTPQARDDVRWLLWFDPGHADALGVHGRSLVAEKQFEPAITSLEEIPHDADAFRDAGYPLGIALLATARLAEAEEVLADYVARYPENRAARDELRWLYFNEFRTHDVIGLLEEALRPPLNDLTVLPDLLDSEYHAQTPYEGVAYLDDINRRRPDQVPVMRGLAYCRWQMGQLDEAEQLLERAAVLAPEDLRIPLLWSTLLIDRKEYERARSVLPDDLPPDASTPLSSGDVGQYWYIRSRLAEAADDIPWALAHLEKAVAIQQADRSYQARRADLLRLLNRDDEATEAAQVVGRLAAAEREIQSMMEAGRHHQPTAADCRKFADLCRTLGKTAQADGWLRVEQRFRTNGQSR